MEVNAETVNLDLPTSNRKKEEFREKLLESIEEVLSFSQVVLNFLELNTAFKKDAILDTPAIFSSELEDLFGASVQGIKDLIIERLFSKINQKYRKERDKDFEEYISEALDCFMELY